MFGRLGWLLSLCLTQTRELNSRPNPAPCMLQNRQPLQEKWSGRTPSQGSNQSKDPPSTIAGLHPRRVRHRVCYREEHFWPEDAGPRNLDGPSRDLSLRTPPATMRQRYTMHTSWFAHNSHQTHILIPWCHEKDQGILEDGLPSSARGVELARHDKGLE